MMKNKKIIVLALILLIIAGVVVVCLKGFCVDLMLKQHDSIEYKINEDFEIADIKNITKDVLGDKKFEIRIIELFDDAISINAENITTEEAESLVKKLDEKYKKTEVKENTENVAIAENADETNNTEKNIEIISNPKIKLFSLFKVYIVPSIIAGVIIILYAGIRFKKLGSLKTMEKLVCLVIITVLSLLSIIAIVRFPINIYVIPTIMLCVLAELIIFFSCKEKELKKVKEE